jgi:1,2-diacylglycerol 3-beta-glucosyltransferase
MPIQRQTPFLSRVEPLHKNIEDSMPHGGVSILVAARNEAANILDCLQALEALTYPKEKLQILIGDDASEDETAAITAHFIADKPHFKLIRISNPDQQSMSAPDLPSRPELKGKTRVLAQLAHHATGEYLFFTDADIEVPPHWIENMLPHFEHNVGVVTGITTMQPKWTAGQGWLGDLQGLEWLYYLSFVRLFSLFEVPITAMGNNMAVSRAAYNAVGGYETVGFSITEDYALFRAILAKDFRFVQLFDRRVLTISKPIPTLGALLMQRKRWMYGAMSLPWQQRLGVYFNGLLLPLLLLLGLFAPKAAIWATIIGYILATAWLASIVSWLSLRHLWAILPLFWGYHVVMNFAMLVNFYARKQTIWKGRQY